MVTRSQALHESLLTYRRFRYFKLAVGLSLLAGLAYALLVPARIPNGGTPLGYTLGIVGALLILWLTAYGVRKRSYHSTLGTTAGWLSAHVYLGLALVVIVTLHSGFQFAYNIHTLAYLLTLGTVASGLLGVYAYRRYPALMTRNRRGKTLTSMLVEIAEIDRDCREAASSLDDDINRAVLEASDKTRLGGDLFEQLRGDAAGCATEVVWKMVTARAADSPLEQAQAFRALLTLIGKKRALLERARRDIAYKARLDLWPLLHVPLAFALLAALLAHVTVVLWYG